MLNYQRVPQFFEIITSETGDLCNKGVVATQRGCENGCVPAMAGES